MDKTRDVAVIVGSLRKDSINRKVAHALGEVAPSGLKLSIIEIGQLPSRHSVRGRHESVSLAVRKQRRPQVRAAGLPARRSSLGLPRRRPQPRTRC